VRQFSIPPVQVPYLTTAIKLNERVVLRSLEKPIGSWRVENRTSFQAHNDWLEQFGAESKINRNRDEYGQTEPQATERPLCGSAEIAPCRRANLAKHKVASDRSAKPEPEINRGRSGLAARSTIVVAMIGWPVEGRWRAIVQTRQWLVLAPALIPDLQMRPTS
jgi:hypothetical protein